MKQLIEIKKLSVEIDKKAILKNISFTAKQGDIIAILGSNGAGKSTILKTIMRHFDTKITSGEILYNSTNILKMQTNDIANLGFYYCSQNPIELEGVKLIDLYKMILNSSSKEPVELFELFSKINPMIKQYDFDSELLNRYNNVNFSGGQKKKNELIQMELFNPNVILFDEVDSGLDIDTIKILAKKIDDFKNEKIIFIISHQLDLLKMIKPNKVILLADGEIVKVGDYDFMLEIFQKGFSKYVKNNNEFEDIDVLKVC